MTSKTGFTKKKQRENSNIISAMWEFTIQKLLNSPQAGILLAMCVGFCATDSKVHLQERVELHTRTRGMLADYVTLEVIHYRPTF